MKTKGANRFGKKENFTTFVIRKRKGHDIYYSTPENVDEQKGREEINKELQENFVVLWYHNIPGLEEYYSEADSHKWDRKEKKFIIRSSSTNYELYLKRDLEALGFVLLPEQYENAVELLDVKYYHVHQGNYFVSPEDLKRIKNAVETEQKPLVLKGTDWHYWFNVEGKLIPSTTSSWFNFLYKDHKVLVENMLEAYTGPDKYEEHKDDRK